MLISVNSQIIHNPHLTEYEILVNFNRLLLESKVVLESRYYSAKLPMLDISKILRDDLNHLLVNCQENYKFFKNSDYYRLTEALNILSVRTMIFRSCIMIFIMIDIMIEIMISDRGIMITSVGL